VPTHQPTFDNKLVALLARSGHCIELDGYTFERILGGLELLHQFLEGIARLPSFFSSLKAGPTRRLAFQDGSRCFLSSRAMP
jgi:hypothetical protein